MKINDKYLFKAKTFNEEWVTGLLAYRNDKYYISNKEGAPFAYEVRPDSICRCIGLKDKNNTLMWENDIVEIPAEDGFFTITWDEDTARFIISNDDFIVDFDNFWAYQIEVMGNIFDDPELLECAIENNI